VFTSANAVSEAFAHFRGNAVADYALKWRVEIPNREPITTFRLGVARVPSNIYA
jgi:hypothetical protein